MFHRLQIPQSQDHPEHSRQTTQRRLKQPARAMSLARQIPPSPTPLLPMPPHSTLLIPQVPVLNNPSAQGPSVNELDTENLLLWVIQTRQCKVLKELSTKILRLRKSSSSNSPSGESPAQGGANSPEQGSLGAINEDTPNAQGSSSNTPIAQGGPNPPAQGSQGAAKNARPGSTRSSGSANGNSPVQGQQVPSKGGPASPAGGEEAEAAKTMTIEKTLVPVPVYSTQTETIPAGAESKAPKVVTIEETLVPFPVYATQTETIRAGATVTPFPTGNNRIHERNRRSERKSSSINFSACFRGFGEQDQRRSSRHCCWVHRSIHDTVDCYILRSAMFL